MIINSPQIYLASKSPRRKHLLSQINIKFESFSVEMDEIFKDNEKPKDTVIRLANEKMELAKQEKKDGIIITADTIVVLDDVRIGKPSDKNDAIEILTSLSGNTHFVYTGFTL